MMRLPVSVFFGIVEKAVLTDKKKMNGYHGGHEMMEHDHMNHMDHMESMHDMNHEGHLDHMKNMDLNMEHMHGMNHSGQGNHNMMMEMYFTFSSSATVLFKEWSFTTVAGLIGSMVGIFLLAAFYEGVKYFREYLFWKTYNASQYRAVRVKAVEGSVEDPQNIQMMGDMLPNKPPTMFSGIHILQTFLHMFQVLLSYFLMLIFMTYNVWLCLAVILGAGVGYFLFGWMKSPAVDVTEHCQ